MRQPFLFFGPISISATTLSSRPIVLSGVIVSGIGFDLGDIGHVLFVFDAMGIDPAFEGAKKILAWLSSPIPGRQSEADF